MEIWFPAIAFAVALCAPAFGADVCVGPGVGGSGWVIAVAEPRADAQGFSIETAGSWFDYANTGYERAAADELAVLVERMTGFRPAVVVLKDKAEAEHQKRLIAVGRLAVDLGAKPPASKYGIDGSVVDIGPDRILLAGETPMASYFAMTRLAEMAGCRWYMSGPLGEVVPKRETLQFRAGHYEEVPPVWCRWFWFDGGTPGGTKAAWAAFNGWMLHNRQYGLMVECGHRWELVIPADKYFKDHPEWFALVDGERRPGMLCTTNEEMTREFVNNYRRMIEARPQIVYHSLSQTDGMDFCECPNCRALDPKPPDVTTPNSPQISDRLVNFYNKVVSELVKDYPDKYFCFLAYVQSTAPPTREKPHPHLMPMIAVITYSRYHAMGAPNSETMQALQTYMEGWGKLCESFGYYPYCFNLGDGLLPYTREHQARHDMPFLVKNHMGATCCETINAWYNLLPYYYIMARMNLDPNLDAGALVDEFYSNFFGPAGVDMRAYMDLLDETYKSFDYEIGGLWAAHLIFTPDLMRKLNVCLSAAERKAKGNPVLIEKVAMWRFGYRCAELFLKMRAQVNAFRFEDASRTAARMRSLLDALLARNPVAAAPFAFEYVMKPYWQNPIDLCAQKLHGARILHKFPDEWHAFLGYSRIGRMGGFYRPDFPLTRWIKLKTYSASLGEQKITRFRGVIWYRNSFQVPPEAAGKKLRLLFTYVSTAMELYINGKKVDESAGSRASGTQDFDVTGCVRGGENTIACSINNEYPDDIDVGGIMRPVVLYEPADADSRP